MTRGTLLAVLWIGLFLTGGLARAGEPADPEPYSLGEIVVAGRPAGVQASETVHEVTSSEIRESGARTLDQAIDRLPGVNIRVGPEGVPRIDIRGFRTRHVKLLLNGVPLNSAFDQQFDPSAIPTEDIAEIRVTEGTSSVLYGQGGLGGVINILTKKGTEGLRGTISGEAGDHEPYLARASLSGAEGDLDFFLSGSAQRVDAFPLSTHFEATSEQEAGYRDNSDRERQSAFGNVGWHLGDGLRLGLTLTYTRGQYGKPASVVNDPFDPFASPPKYVRVDDYETLSSQLAVEAAVSPRLNLRGWTFYNQGSERTTRYDDETYTTSDRVTGSYRARAETAIQGLTLQPEVDLGAAGVLTFSASAEQDRWKNRGTTTVAPNTLAPLHEDRHYEVYSGAIQYEFSPLRPLGLSAGWAYHRQNRAERHDGDYSLTAGVRYDLGSGTRLKASFSRNIRFPTLRDLYDVSKGNPDLVPERARTFEVGVEQDLAGSTVVTVSGFHTSARNLIQTDQAAGKSANLSEIRFRGLEFAATTEFLPRLRLRASCTFLQSDDRSRPGRDQHQYAPRDKVALEARYDFPGGFSPYVSFLYVGHQYFYTKNNVTPVQKDRLQDYALVNLRLNQRLSGDRLSLYLGADNLFDRNYETSYGFPQPGRFVYAGLEVRI